MPLDALTTRLVADTLDHVPEDDLSAHQSATQNPQRPGLTLTEIAKKSGIDRATLCALMIHHRYLELAYCDGTQRRHLLTEQAVDAGLGCNAFPVIRSRGGAPHADRSPFPLFNPDLVPAILWTLDYERLVATVQAIPSKRKRAGWLLDRFPFLPRQELARLAGYTEWGWAKRESCHASLDSGAGDQTPEEGYLTAWLQENPWLIRKPAHGSSPKAATQV